MKSPFRASKCTIRRSRSTSYRQTSSGSGSCNVTVLVVEVSAPNNGNVVETAQSLDGSIETKCSASVSPGSAPST